MSILSFIFNEYLLGIICQVTTILLYLSGAQVIKNIIHKGSTHGISILPFLTCAVSCTIWLKYALIMNDKVLIVTNFVGTLLEWFYVLVYLLYLPTDISKNTSVRRWLTIQLVFMFGILLTASQPKYSEFEFTKLKEFLVKVCVFTNICNYMSPLGQAIHCYTHKSTENLSLVLSFTYWLQVMSWLFYGLATMKTVVMVPNAVGSVLTTFTMSLFFIYPNRSAGGISGANTGYYDANRRMSGAPSSIYEPGDDRPHII